MDDHEAFPLSELLASDDLDNDFEIHPSSSTATSVFDVSLNMTHIQFDQQQQQQGLQCRCLAPLTIKECTSDKCCFKVMLREIGDQDAVSEVKECYTWIKNNKGSGVYDRIGVCTKKECRKIYHLCPVPGCKTRKCVVGRQGKRGISNNAYADFRKHFIVPKETVQPSKLHLHSPSAITNDSYSSQGSPLPEKTNDNRKKRARGNRGELTSNRNSKRQQHQYQVEPYPCNSFDRDDFLDLDDHASLVVSNDFEKEIGRILADIDSEPETFGVAIQKILDDITNNTTTQQNSIPKILELLGRIPKDILSNGQVSIQLAMALHSSMSGGDCIDHLKKLKVHIENVPILEEVKCHVTVIVNDSAVSTPLSSNQSQMGDVMPSLGSMSPKVGIGCLIFVFEYDLRDLHTQLTKSGNSLFPKKLPVNFSIESGNDQSVFLDVEGINIIIPLKEDMEDKLIEKGCISLDEGEYNEDIDVTWYRTLPYDDELAKQLDNIRINLDDSAHSIKAYKESSKEGEYQVCQMIKGNGNDLIVKLQSKHLNQIKLLTSYTTLVALSISLDDSSVSPDMKNKISQKQKLLEIPNAVAHSEAFIDQLNFFIYCSAGELSKYVARYDMKGIKVPINFDEGEGKISSVELPIKDFVAYIPSNEFTLELLKRTNANIQEEKVEINDKVDLQYNVEIRADAVVRESVSSRKEENASNYMNSDKMVNDKLGKYLQSPNPKELDFQGFSMTGSSFDILVNAIPKFESNLKVLKLGQNVLNSDDAIKLFDRLLSNQTIEEIQLKWNKIDEGCLEKLFELISKNKTIKTIDLTNNKRYPSEQVSKFKEQIKKINPHVTVKF